MKKLLLSVTTLAGLALGGSAFAAGPACAEAQDDSWMQLDAVQQTVESMGYTIDDMGISEGNCYEVTGLNSDGQSVTAYLDPRTGEGLDEAIAQ